MRTFVWLAFAAIALSACEDRGVDVRSTTLSDYSIDQARYCFCPRYGDLMRIAVRSDSIASIVDLAADTILSRSFWGGYRTIRGLFEEIARQDTSLWIVEVTMDSTNTYPTRLSIIPRAKITDVGILYVTSNLVKLD